MSKQTADYVAIIERALADRVPADWRVDLRAVAQGVELDLLAAGFQIGAMDPRVKSLTEPFRKRHSDGGDDRES